MKSRLTNKGVTAILSGALSMLVDPDPVQFLFYTHKFDKFLPDFFHKRNPRSYATVNYYGTPSKEFQQILMAKAAEKRERKMERNLRNREAMLKGSYKEAA